MSTDELTIVREARPAVDPPTAGARAAAQERLYQAIASAPPAAPADAAHAPAGRSRRVRRRVRIPALGTVVAATTVLVAVAVAAVVLMSVRHGASRQPGTAATAPRAVRGEILAAGGQPLALTTTTVGVTFDRDRLPRSASARAAELQLVLRLALGTANCSDARSTAIAVAACRMFTLALTDARPPRMEVIVTDRGARALRAHRQELPGIEVPRPARRTYPYGDTAAQLLGTVGQVTSAELREPRFRGVAPDAVVGRSGLEYEYERSLQAGDSLKTSIDVRVEQVGQAALAQSVDAVPGSLGGAFVAMDPENGQIYAMGSNPTYNPSLFTKPITESAYQREFGSKSGNPLLNRATQSVGATGSVLTPITALAALESGVWTTTDSYDDTGEFCFPGTSDCLHNSGHAAYGDVDLPSALRVSDGVFFYHLGYLLNADPDTHPNGGALQYWARMLGIGEPTGIDLPAAATGTLPTPNLLKALYKEEIECENATGPYKNHPKHPASQGGCGIANTPYWTVGDNVNTAVGQGDVQVSPLQLAVAYGALANGGTVVTPHVGEDIQTASGQVVERIDPGARRHLSIRPAYLRAILAGLHDAAQTAGGTSDDVMGSFDQTVYGATGTAQYIPTSGSDAGEETDYAWYAGFVPASATSKPIVVVVWVQQGGFGDVSAAPVARQILSEWFNGRPGPYITGTSTTT